MIKSVDKTMLLLEKLSDAKGKPLRPLELAEQTGETPSTCSHILKTLLEKGYVERVSHKEGYVLGPNLYYLTRHGKYENELINLCHPVMNYASKLTGEAILLSTIRNGTKFIIETIDKTNRIFSDVQSIRQDTIYRTATGRMLLAHADRWELRDIYNTLGNPSPNEWEGVTSFDDLKKALAQINKREILRTDFYLEDETGNVIVTLGYAFPLYRKNQCIAALGMACQFPREHLKVFETEREPTVKKIFLKAAKELNRRLNFK